MKSVKTIFFVLPLLMLGVMSFQGCGGSASTQNADSKYMCPMECEGSSVDEPGQCPVCGMDLVLREGEAPAGDAYDHGHDHSGEAHDHEHAHEGDMEDHDHAHEGDAHDHEHEGDAHDHEHDHEGEAGHDHSH